MKGCAVNWVRQNLATNTRLDIQCIGEKSHFSARAIIVRG